MDLRMLSDTEWFRIPELLPGKPTDKGGRAVDNRRFVQAVLYLACTGSPWPDLPILTAGQVANVTQGAALVEAILTGAVIADKGNDSDALADIVEACGAEAIIPARSHRNTQRKAH